VIELPQIPYELERAAPLCCDSVGALRSVTFISNGLDDSERRLYLADCSRWIREYHEWFSNAVGAYQGRGLHLFYDRDITLTGEFLLRCSAELRLLGTTSRELGFSFSLSVSAEHLEDDLPSILSLTSDKVVSALAIYIEPSMVDETFAVFVNSVERLIQQRVNVGIIGDMNRFTSLGLLSSHVVSAADLTWYPSTPLNQRAYPITPVRSCHARMRLVVDSSGFMYPCFGLVGKTEGMLGNIYEPIEKTALVEPSVLKLLDRWQKEGPDLEEASPEFEEQVSEDEMLPPVCRWHRKKLV